MLTALMPDTKLVVWPKSIGWMANPKRLPMKIAKETLTLNPGDVVLFRADLVHAGAKYPKKNLRIHCFLQCDDNDRRPNETMIMQVQPNADGLDRIRRFPKKRDASPKRT
jgi:hypothetical protein